MWCRSRKISEDSWWRCLTGSKLSVPGIVGSLTFVQMTPVLGRLHLDTSSSSRSTELTRMFKLESSDLHPDLHCSDENHNKQTQHYKQFLCLEFETMSNQWLHARASKNTKNWQIHLSISSAIGKRWYMLLVMFLVRLLRKQMKYDQRRLDCGRYIEFSCSHPHRRLILS